MEGIAEGTVRQVQSPPLEGGKPFVFQLRAAFRVGDNLLIEDRQVTVGSGELGDVSFDGKRALSVPLPRSNRGRESF